MQPRKQKRFLYIICICPLCKNMMSSTKLEVHYCLVSYTLCPGWNGTKIQIHLNTTQLNRNVYQFIYTNCSLLNTNCTSYNVQFLRITISTLVISAVTRPNFKSWPQENANQTKKSNSQVFIEYSLCSKSLTVSQTQARRWTCHWCTARSMMF